MQTSEPDSRAPAFYGDPAGPTTRVERNFLNRLGSLRESQAFHAYRRARSAVYEMLGLSDQTSDASAYWKDEIATFRYMFDASPLVVTKLREHTHHITGLKPYDYRDVPGCALQQGINHKFTMLKETADGCDLLVPEAEDLGGFGFETQGHLCNVDTLKFWESMIALDRSGVLQPYRDPPSDRHVVWEIGGGWGGFARCFKTLCPETTYLILDLPETILYSATYLGAIFPDAQLYFHRPGTSVPPATWREADFVFVPHTALDEIDSAPISLMMNMVSFQEMTSEQVTRYIDAAAGMGVRTLYSLNRDRGPYNAEIGSVSEIMASRFQLQEIEVLPIPYTKLILKDDRQSDKKAIRGHETSQPEKSKDKSKKAVGSEKSQLTYRHLVGTLR